MEREESGLAGQAQQEQLQMELPRETAGGDSVVKLVPEEQMGEAQMAEGEDLPLTMGDDGELDSLPAVDLSVEAFAKNAEAAQRMQVTELLDSGKVIIPTSLTFWSQPATARNAPHVVEIPADNRGTVIRSRITGHNGERVNITYFDCQMEATIAQMVAENGLPLCVTPAQIYRKFAQMGREERVTAKQEEEVITSIDKLLSTPATLDFTQEIQNHTKLKRNPEYNYNNTVIEGTLITGLRIQQTHIKAASPSAAEHKLKAYYYKGRIVENCYIIYAMPMYAVHDHMVNQIVSYPSRFLNSPEGSGHQADLPEKREPTNASHVMAMRRYILLQVTRMRRNQENERANYRRRGLPCPETHTERITFARIAENSDIVLTPRSLRTLRTNTERILNELRAESVLVDFVSYKKGRAIEGFQVTV